MQCLPRNTFSTAIKQTNPYLLNNLSLKYTGTRDAGADCSLLPPPPPGQPRPQ